ncbi:MAG: hypothetical protein IJ351_03860, partial [Oscillospiraceae bacterium]|nr:hypothetical protein [Oscillospiraceae bacterium]
VVRALNFALQVIHSDKIEHKKTVSLISEAHRFYFGTYYTAPSPQAIITHFPENQKNSNIFLIALSVTPYGVPVLPKGEPSRLCCKLKNNLSFLH